MLINLLYSIFVSDSTSEDTAIEHVRPLGPVDETFLKRNMKSEFEGHAISIPWQLLKGDSESA